MLELAVSLSALDIESISLGFDRDLSPAVEAEAVKRAPVYNNTAGYMDGRLVSFRSRAMAVSAKAF